ncbi:MAG: sulfatase-like hydrolase/transferase [bacterium]
MTVPTALPARVLRGGAAGAAAGALALGLVGAVDVLRHGPLLLSPWRDISLLAVGGAVLGLAVGALRAWSRLSSLHPFGLCLGVAVAARFWLGTLGGAGLLGGRAAAEGARGLMLLLAGAAAGQILGLALRRLPLVRRAGPSPLRDVGIACALALPAFWPSPPPSGTGAPNVLLLTVDTLRADRLGVSGFPQPTTPWLDRLARSSTVQARAVTPQPRTLPALASLLTGRVPPRHGVRDNFHYALGPAATTLAERFAAAGWATAAVNSNPVLAHDSGIDQGFASASDRGDDWARLPLVRGVSHLTTLLAMRRGDREAITTELALDWLHRRPRGRPFLLWVHYLAPHMPYEPVFPFDRRFDPGYAGPYARSIDYGEISKGDMTYRNPLAPRTLEHVKALYDGEVATSDRAIGRLLRTMEERGDLANTIVVLTADHGESLDEDGYFLNHGDFVYGPATNVPLIWRVPGEAASVRDDAPALVDVFALLLHAAGLPPDPDADGRWPSGEGRVVFGESDFCRFPDLNHRLGYLLPPEVAQSPEAVPDWKERWEEQANRAKQRFVENGRFKLVLTPRPDGDRFELFDLSADPGETLDVSASRPDVLSDLSTQLAAWMRAESAEAGTARERVIRGNLREEMGGLGYLGR